ncbi:MAG: glycine/D-amino acid oxidase-like deaminating enzyme [Parasphingorhabdus sp.]|jgi:glycine/D-amino acid oxidase-like deaminating enzyme
MISAQQVKEKLPVMNTEDILGALWSPGDRRVNPTDLVNAYTREAKTNGVQFFEGVNVSHALTENGGVTGVSTDKGDIQCEIVINCTGLWARELGLRMMSLYRYML